MFGRILRIMVVGSFCVAFLGSAWGAGEDKEIKSPRPDKQPKIDQKQLESFQKSNAEIADLYASVQGKIDELSAALEQMGGANAKDKRKLEKQERSLRGEITRDRRKLDKLLEKQIAPAEQAYLENKGKVDGYNDKAKKAEGAGDEKKAQKLYQEAAKYNGATESAKRKLDLLYYHTFFTGDEILKDGE